MSDKKTKVDPLLGGEESPSETKETTTKPAKVEAPVAPKAITPKDKLKAEAVAKFPNDPIAQTKHILDNSEKISFMIPKIEGEVGMEEVTINGYKLTLLKGEVVSIPIQVAMILSEKYRINLNAGVDKRIDRSADTEQALG